MNYSVEILNEIEKLANLLTLPDDIALIIETDTREFKDLLKEKDSMVYRSFYRGLYNREMDIRKNNLKPVDVETSLFENTQLKDFKSQLIISLENY